MDKKQFNGLGFGLVLILAVCLVLFVAHKRTSQELKLMRNSFPIHAFDTLMDEYRMYNNLLEIDSLQLNFPRKALRIKAVEALAQAECVMERRLSREQRDSLFTDGAKPLPGPEEPIELSEYPGCGPHILLRENFFLFLEEQKDDREILWARMSPEERKDTAVIINAYRKELEEKYGIKPCEIPPEELSSCGLLSDEKFYMPDTYEGIELPEGLLDPNTSLRPTP